MLEFFQVMFSAITATRSEANQPANKDFGYVFTRVFTPQLVNRLEALLVRAERRAHTQHPRGFLKAPRLFLDYLKLNVAMMDKYRRFQEKDSKETLLALKEAVDAWKADRETILDYCRDRQFASRYLPYADLVERTIRQPHGKSQLINTSPPVSLDFPALLRKHGVEVKTSPK